jgi:hypothetical protein
MKTLLSILSSLTIGIAPVASVSELTLRNNINQVNESEFILPVVIEDNLNDMKNILAEGYSDKNVMTVVKYLLSAQTNLYTLTTTKYFEEYGSVAEQVANLYQVDLSNIVVQDSNFYQLYTDNLHLNYQKKSELDRNPELKALMQKYQDNILAIGSTTVDLYEETNTELSLKISTLTKEINDLELRNSDLRQKMQNNDDLNVALNDAIDIIKYPKQLANNFDKVINQSFSRLTSYYESAKHYASVAKWTGWFPGAALIYNNQFRNAITNTSDAMDSFQKVFKDENSEGGKMLAELQSSLASAKDDIKNKTEKSGLWEKVYDVISDSIPNFPEIGFADIGSIVNSAITSGLAAVPVFGPVLNAIASVINGIWNAYKMVDVFRDDVKPNYDTIHDAFVDIINHDNDIKASLDDVINVLIKKIADNKAQNVEFQNEIDQNQISINTKTDELNRLSDLKTDVETEYKTILNFGAMYDYNFNFENQFEDKKAFNFSESRTVEEIIDENKGIANDIINIVEKDIDAVEVKAFILSDMQLSQSAYNENILEHYQKLVQIEGEI